jgi:hypothetical protein
MGGSKTKGQLESDNVVLVVRDMHVDVLQQLKIRQVLQYKRLLALHDLSGNLCVGPHVHHPKNLANGAIVGAVLEAVPSICKCTN